MRILSLVVTSFLLSCTIILAQEATMEYSIKSPNKKYTVQQVNDEVAIMLEIKQGNKLLHRVGSGFGGYYKTTWSSDSKLLATEEHATKTSGLLHVFSVEDGKAEELRLPDYRLYIAGYFMGETKTALGVREGHENIKWEIRKDDSDQDMVCLSFQAVGGLENAPDLNIYRFDVVISFEYLSYPRLLSISINEQKTR